MADAVRVSDLHFCEIGRERDGVNVDVGQLPAIAGAIPSLTPPIATETAEVTESPHEQRAKGRKPLVRLFGDVSAVTENLMADENRFCVSMGRDKFIAVYGNGAPLQRSCPAA